MYEQKILSKFTALINANSAMSVYNKSTAKAILVNVLWDEMSKSITDRMHDRDVIGDDQVKMYEDRTMGVIEEFLNPKTK
jgi:hypothetical protein